MRRGIWLITGVLLVCTSILIYTWFIKSVPAITYFPEDDDIKFQETSSHLDMVSEKTNDSYEIIWESRSISERPLYLRQDASLLFDNGRLQGIHSKWKENTNTIQFREKIYGEDSNFFQAITYHHGEVHYPDDHIKSIHDITYDHLYVIDSPNTILESFKQPETDYEHEWARLLDHTTQQQLHYYWNQLIRHFNIDHESYLTVPLTALHQYTNKPIPSFNQEQTSQIIGQLWEGIYKNYIINAKTIENSELNSYIPLILFDKENTHLIVLYELNGEKERLYQRYPEELR